MSAWDEYQRLASDDRPLAGAQRWLRREKLKDLGRAMAEERAADRSPDRHDGGVVAVAFGAAPEPPGPLPAEERDRFLAMTTVGRLVLENRLPPRDADVRKANSGLTRAELEAVMRLGPLAPGDRPDVGQEFNAGGSLVG